MTPLVAESNTSAPARNAILRDTLRRIPYFHGLREDVLDRIARGSIARSYAPGHALFRQGEEAHGFFVVLAGAVKVTRAANGGEETVLHLMRPGDFIGEVPLHAGTPYPATATATEESRLLYIPRDVLFNAVRSEPEIAMRLLAMFSKRLLALVTRFEGLAHERAPARLARFLLETARRTGERMEKNGTTFPLEYTRGEIARLVGVRRETVSRILSEWQRKGWVEVDRRRCVIRNEKALADLR